jgi:ferredoxin
MKVKVDPDLCTACELCTETCPEVFEMGEDIAIVKVGTVPSDLEESARQAAEDCPAEAIIVEE